VIGDVCAGGAAVAADAIIAPNENHSLSSATELLARLRAGEVSSRELLESYLQRIERHNPVSTPS
jgi:hypothetical protein